MNPSLVVLWVEKWCPLPMTIKKVKTADSPINDQTIMKVAADCIGEAIQAIEGDAALALDFC